MGFKGISNKELVDFNKTLSLMLLSRLSVVQSLEILHAQMKNEKFKKILKSILGEIKSGHTMSKSFSRYPDLFDELYIANLRVAEETGMISEVLTEYTAYLENIQSLKRKISQAARYPLLVLTVAMAVVIFMVFFLIPTFEGLFFSSKMSLPPLTSFIMSVSYFIKDNGLIIALILSALAVISFRKRKTPRIKKALDEALISIPLVSKLYSRNLLARFSLSMAILLKSRVTLLEALKISKNISGNVIFRSEIDHVIKKLVKGETFSSNISHSRFFDLTFSRLLTVGEEGAELDQVFTLISNYYSKEFDYYLDNVTSLIEPILILFIGMIVAVILIAMYLPMFELINNFGV